MNNVRDFGAVGDGFVKDTAAVQAALDRGGRVVLPPGTYLCGSLYLHSRTLLELEPGARILGSPDIADYNDPAFDRRNRACPQEKAFGQHLLIAQDAVDVTIRGGEIDGNRAAFFDPALYSRDDFPGVRPSQMLYFKECAAVTLENIRLVNAPYWACFLHGCEDVRLTGITVRNPRGVWNGDGFDIDCCRRVAVSDCDIDSSDDSLAIRAAALDQLDRSPGVTSDVVVTNCVLASGQAAIRLGVGTGLIRNCLLSNIRVRHSQFGIVLLSSYLPDEFPGGADGVGISDVQFSNLDIEAAVPFDISSNWTNPPLKRSKRTIENIFFRKFRVRGDLTNLIQGNLDRNVRHLVFSEVSMVQTGRGDTLPPDDRINGREVYRQPYGWEIVNAEDIRFERCRWTWESPAAGWRGTVHSRNNADLAFTDSEFAPPPGGGVLV